MTGFEERYGRLSGSARALLDTWLELDATPSPPAGSSSGGRDADSSAPLSNTERVLLSLWRSVLEDDRIGVDDDYLSVGGDSIRAIVIVARAEAAGLTFSTQDLMDARTVRVLARDVRVGLPGAQPSGSAPTDRAAPGLPLTGLQEGLLYHALRAGRDLYLAEIECDLVGELDPAAFRSAWRLVVDAHDALRCAFAFTGDDAVRQYVVEDVMVPWEFRDVQEDPAKERAAADFAARVRAEGVDPGSAPLLRLGLFRVRDDVHRFVLIHHHLVLDGWSLELVVGDVLGAYEALVQGQVPAVPVRPGPEVAIAATAPQDEERARAFWSHELAGVGGVPAPDALDGALVLASTTLDAATVQRVRGLCSTQRLTLALVMQAAWALALARARRIDDVVIGVTVSGRTTTSADGVGMFINTLPVRVALPGDRAVSSWLADLMRRRVEAFDRAHDPLTRIARWVGLPPGRALFDTLVVIEDFPAPHTRQRAPGGVAIDRLTARVDEGYPAVLEVTGGSGPLTLSVRGVPSLLDEVTAADLLAAMDVVLTALPGGPDISLRDLTDRLDAETSRRHAARRSEQHARASKALDTSVRRRR